MKKHGHRFPGFWPTTGSGWIATMVAAVLVMTLLALISGEVPGPANPLEWWSDQQVLAAIVVVFCTPLTLLSGTFSMIVAHDRTVTVALAVVAALAPFALLLAGVW